MRVAALFAVAVGLLVPVHALNVPKAISQPPSVELYRRQNLSSVEAELNTTVTALLYYIETGAGPTKACPACMGVVKALQDLAAFGDVVFGGVLTVICTESKLEDPDVCAGFVDENVAAVSTVVSKIDPLGYAGQLFCATILDACPYPSVVNQTLTFPAAPDKIPSHRSHAKKPLTVVHFSDWHYDPLYTTGTEALCTKPLCCRGFNSTTPNKATLPAPSWGAFECDTPLKLGESMLASVPQLLGKQPDFTIFTGDVPPHDIWSSTDESVIANENTSYKLFHQAFSGKVYPTVGNHETSPVNLFQPADIANPPDNQYLFNNLTAYDWTGWLDPHTLAYARTHRGSYSTKVMPGLKLISLDSNDCYVDNFWLYIDAQEPDPNGQLAWLANELAASEKIGEKVWIISHVAAGLSDCLHNWSNMHNSIVQRYHKTISGIFSGHTHTDQFELYYSNDTAKTTANAVSVGWIGPSVTPYTQLNPGWRVYSVDPTTFEILDSVTYIANLSLAAHWDATGAKPTWFKEYSAREYLPSWPSTAPLNATFWAEVTALFETDDALFQQYYQRFYKMGPGAAVACGAACKADFIIDIMSGNSVTAGYENPLRKRELDLVEEGMKKRTSKRDKPWKKDMCRFHSHH